MVVTNKDVLKWMEENKETIVNHINSLNYQDLKNMHIECEKRIGFEKENKAIKDSTPFFKNSDYEKNIKDFYCELKYLTHSLDFCKTNISGEQYSMLDTFSNVQYFYKHRNTNPNEKLDSAYWAELLDNNNISWSLQNLISDITDNYENKDKYLSTHLKANGINTYTLNNRAKELMEFYTKEAQDSALNNLMDSFEDNISETRFAIEETVFYGGVSIKESVNSFEEIQEIYDNKYSILGDAYTNHDIVLINRNNEKIEKQVHEYLIEIMDENLEEDMVVLIDSKSNQREFSQIENNSDTFYKVYLYREEDFEPKFNVGLNREDAFKQFDTKDKAVIDFYLTSYQELKNSQSLSQENNSIKKSLNKNR